MDNVSAHKVDGVCEHIQASGSSVGYLLPYSPDLNSIEKAWSKLKQGSAPTPQGPSMTANSPSPTPSKPLPQGANVWFRRFGDFACEEML